MKARLIRRLVTILAAAMTMVALIAAPALAGPPAEGCFRIEVLTNGSSGSVSWTFTGDQSVTVTGPVLSVTVKGGPSDGAIYTTPPFTDLTAPINPNNGKPYGISHVDICPDDQPMPMCLGIRAGEVGTTTTHYVNGTSVDVSWEADGFTWIWADGLDPTTVRLRVLVSRGVSTTIYGPEGSYVGAYMGITACYCPRVR